MADDVRDLEYTLRIRDEAAKALDSIERKLVVIDKRMVDVGTTSTKTNQDAQRGFDRTSTTVTTAAGKFDKLGASIGIASASLQSLGVEGAGATGALVNRFAALAAGAGPVAIAIGAIATVAWATDKVIEAFTANATRRMEEVAAATARSRDIVTTLRTSADAIRAQAAAAARGSTVEIEAGRAAVELLRRTVEGTASRRARTTGDEGLELQSALDDQRRLLQSAEDYLTTTVTAESDKRAKATQDEMKKRADAWREGYAALANASMLAAQQADAASRDFSTVLDARLAEIATAEGNALSGVRDPGERAQIEARFESERARARSEANARFFASRQSLQGQTNIASIVGTGLEADLARLEEEHRQAVAAATRNNEDVAAVDDLYRTKAAALREEDAAKQAQLAKDLAEKKALAADAAYEQERKDLEASAKATDAALEAAEKLAARNAEAIRRRGEDVLQIEQASAARSLALTQTTSERIVTEINLRYDEEIRQLQARHATEEELERVHAARLKDLATASSPSLSTNRRDAEDRRRMVLDNPSGSFGEGFSAQIDTMTANLESAAEIGATAAQRLSDGFSGAFTSIATGSASAGEAFKAFGLSIVETALQIATQQAVISLLGAAFGAAAAPTASAAGGTVGGGAGKFPFMPGGFTAKADGGIVDRPTMTLHGEAGPEAFVPRDSGAIPVRLKGGAGGSRISISQSFHVSGGMDERSNRELRRQVREETLAAVRQAMRNDTDMRSAVRRI